MSEVAGATVLLKKLTLALLADPERFDPSALHGAAKEAMGLLAVTTQSRLAHAGSTDELHGELLSMLGKSVGDRDRWAVCVSMICSLVERVRAEEREACALIADEAAEAERLGASWPYHDAAAVAVAIRARGNR